MADATRAEICAAAVSDAFRDDGEILASSFGTVPAVGARLAKATHARDLLMTDGTATLLEEPLPVGQRELVLRGQVWPQEVPVLIHLPEWVAWVVSPWEVWEEWVEWAA